MKLFTLQPKSILQLQVFHRVDTSPEHHRDREYFQNSHDIAMFQLKIFFFPYGINNKPKNKSDTNIAKNIIILVQKSDEEVLIKSLRE